MRVTIKFDSATTDQVRELSVALQRATSNNRMTLGVEGPEGWHGETPPLTPDQFARVAAHVCKIGAKTYAEVLDGVR
jgi:hypothetical protein